MVMGKAVHSLTHFISSETKNFEIDDQNQTKVVANVRCTLQNETCTGQKVYN